EVDVKADAAAAVRRRAAYGEAVHGERSDATVSGRENGCIPCGDFTRLRGRCTARLDIVAQGDGAVAGERRAARQRVIPSAVVSEVSDGGLDGGGGRFGSGANESFSVSVPPLKV